MNKQTNKRCWHVWVDQKTSGNLGHEIRDSVKWSLWGAGGCKAAWIRSRESGRGQLIRFAAKMYRQESGPFQIIAGILGIRHKKSEKKNSCKSIDIKNECMNVLWTCSKHNKAWRTDGQRPRKAWLRSSGVVLLIWDYTWLRADAGGSIFKNCARGPRFSCTCDPLQLCGHLDRAPSDLITLKTEPSNPRKRTKQNMISYLVSLIFWCNNLTSSKMTVLLKNSCLLIPI